MAKQLTNLQKFQKAHDQVKALHEEMGVLSKKKPDDAINEFKLEFINQVLSEANEVLDKYYLPFDNFRTFEKDDLPTNSDVVIILAQYLKCFRRQHSDS